MSSRILQLKDYYISVDQARYYTSVVSNYIDTATIKENFKFYRTTLPHDMTFTKYDTYTSDEQVEVFSREYKIYYRACVGSLVYQFIYKSGFIFWSTQDGKVSSNTSKVNFEGLVHLLKYIRDNKNLELKYYSRIYDAHISENLRQANIKTNNKLMVLSDFRCQDFPDTVRSTGANIMFYQYGTIDHLTHVPGPFSQYSTESEYNPAWTAGMTPAHFRMLNSESLKNYPGVVPKQEMFS